MRITAKHPVRAAIADLPNYFDSKGEAILALSDVCADHGMIVEIPGMPGNEGYATCRLRPDVQGYVICECCAEYTARTEYDNGLVISWYAMPSGRIELVAYIS